MSHLFPQFSFDTLHRLFSAFIFLFSICHFPCASFLSRFFLLFLIIRILCVVALWTDRQEHMAGHPMFIPQGARKRLLALSELIRLQMHAEEQNNMTAIEV